MKCACGNEVGAGQGDGVCIECRHKEYLAARRTGPEAAAVDIREAIMAIRGVRSAFGARVGQPEEKALRRLFQAEVRLSPLLQYVEAKIANGGVA